MASVKIITDGSCDLPEELLKQWEIGIVHLTVRFKQDEYQSDMDSALFYSMMKTSKELPKTASPSPNDFLEAYKAVEEGKDILVLALSANLSSTYNHAVMAKELFLEEGHKRRVEVLDCKNTSVGLGLIAYKAAVLAKQGKSLDVVKDRVKELIKEAHIYIMLDTLENVIKGGRLNRVRGAVATMLNIKLLMHNSEEGTIELIEKIRGSQNTIKRMIAKIGETKIDSGRDIVAVAHGNCEEKAKSIIETIMSKYPFKKVILSNMGSVIGTYAGEGGILVAF